MDSQPAPQVTVHWHISGYGLRVHAFRYPHLGLDFLEALCGHSVPLTKIVNPREMAETPPPCSVCVQRYDEHG